MTRQTITRQATGLLVALAVAASTIAGGDAAAPPRQPAELYTAPIATTR